VAFCKVVISRHTEDWPPKEETLADEFVRWFGLKSSLTRDELIELCLCKNVILSFVELPPELRGFNCSFQNRTEIVVTQHEAVPGADLHTLLHEFRELLENAFASLGHSTLCAEDFLEVQAERFAMSARMNIIGREIPAFVEIVKNADAKWARCLGYSVIGIAGFLYILTCVFLPQFEEIESEAKRRRYVRT
jgi:hypothetical protein